MALVSRRQRPLEGVRLAGSSREPVSLSVSQSVIYIYIGPWSRRRAQELCESGGGRPGLSVLTSLMVSVDVKQN